MIQYSWWLGGHCELRVLQGDCEGTVAFALIWAVEGRYCASGQEKRHFTSFFRLHIETPLQVGVSKKYNNKKKDTYNTTHQCFLNSQMHVW